MIGRESLNKRIKRQREIHDRIIESNTIELSILDAAMKLGGDKSLDQWWLFTPSTCKTTPQLPGSSASQVT